MKLRPYQTNVINDVLLHLESNKRCCVSLATGGGKTVIFSELVNNLNGRILICVHREELVHQTSRTLKKEHDLLIPKIKGISKDVCVAMVQTLNNRIKKGDVDLNNFDYLIVDEAHRGEFMKILDKFKGYVIGFTATPNYEKNRYFYRCLKCGNDSDVAGKHCKTKRQKFKENVPLSDYYHYLIEGVEINELIEQDFLVPDEVFSFKTQTERLVFDVRTGDYTEESIGLVFGSEDALRNTVKTYKDFALGLKTIIFNPNTLVNKLLYNIMLSEGINVKMYDSNNSEENRNELVDWFKNTRDAVLLNVQVFTTGFDCTDVECIFLNKKTQSINLFLQMVGRGGRITDKIFKPSFRVIDMGENVKDLGKWSDARDWGKYFYLKETKQVGTPIPSSVRTCHECESIVAGNSLSCEVCGVDREYKSKGIMGVVTRDGKPIIPNAAKIVEYSLANNLDCLQARKIVYNYVAEMFENVTKESFFKHKASGKLYEKTHHFLTPYYFAIQKSELQGNKIKRRESFTNETIKEIERRYTTSANL
jgi:superfamily II DNA or RNA helicase